MATIVQGVTVAVSPIGGPDGIGGGGGYSAMTTPYVLIPVDLNYLTNTNWSTPQMQQLKTAIADFESKHPATIGVPPTPSQKEALFITFMAGVGAMGGEAIAGAPGAFGGAILGTAVGFGMENYSQLPLGVQLGVNPYAPQ